METQYRLEELVNLALRNPEIGAVNFNHLYTLLLALVNKVDHLDNTALNTKNIDQQTVIETDEGISDISSQSSKENINPLNENQRNITTQVDRLASTQNKLEDRLKSVEDNLSKFAKNLEDFKFTNNNTSSEGGNSLVRQKDEQINDMSHGDQVGGQTNEQVIDVSQDNKVAVNNTLENSHRLDEAESKIDSLSSMVTNLSDKIKNSSEDMESSKFLESIKNLQNHVDNINERLQVLEEETKTNGELVIESNDLTDNNQVVDMEKKFKEVDEKINTNKKLINEVRDKFENNFNSDSSKDIKISSDDLNNLKVNTKSVTDLQNDMSKAFEKLSTKANQDELSNLEAEFQNEHLNTEKLFTQLDNAISKVKEFENIDTSELKDITENIDALKRMSNEIEDVRKLSHLKDLADNVDDLKKLKLLIDALQLEVDKFKEELHDMKEEGFNGLQDNQKEMVQMITSLKVAQNQIPPSTAYDASVVAAIQNLTQVNRQEISTLKAELNMFKKVHQKKLQQPVSNEDNSIKDNNNNNNNDRNINNDNNQMNSNNNVKENQQVSINSETFEDLQNHVLALEEEQIKVVGTISNITDDMKDEFYRKQQHIDALYGYIETLQNSKADKNDMTSEMDVKADKKTLDEKVNMSTFDERYQMLEQTLQNALDRLDHYVQREGTMNDALNKLNEDVQSKMGSDAEKKLKKFMNERLKEIQKSRVDVAETGDGIVDFDLRNAAGLRKPMELLYHCISCDRPIDITMRGSAPPVPQNFPSKKSMGPYKTYELDQLRQSKRVNIYDKFNVNRPCGGQHTVSNTRLQKSLIPTVQYTVTDSSHTKTDAVLPVPLIDCVVGKDGQIYRGRFRSNEVLPPPIKKLPFPVSRSKFNNKYRSTYSANIIKPNSSSVDDTNRPRSAGDTNRPRSAGDTVLGNHEQVALPPISRESSLIKDQTVVVDEDRCSSVNSVGVVN